MAMAASQPTTVPIAVHLRASMGERTTHVTAATTKLKTITDTAPRLTAGTIRFWPPLKANRKVVARWPTTPADSTTIAKAIAMTTGDASAPLVPDPFGEFVAFK